MDQRPASDDGSSLIFPSLPGQINQAGLLDFMSMMTLMQRRFGEGIPIVTPETTARPARGSSAVPVHRRLIDCSPSPYRDNNTTGSPVRSSLSPVRRCRDFEDSPRSITCSRSPLRTSSSSESPSRDGSPVDFKAAINPECTGRDRTFADGEDEDSSSRKISSARYQIFRQAVTSSKGSFKLNLAKSRRAARASLMDFGDGRVTKCMSWLEQLSLTDTMASTARIAQGLREDQPVEKATLSESLNTESTSFKHLTVKQVFPYEPWRFKRMCSMSQATCFRQVWRLEAAFNLPELTQDDTWHRGAH